MWQIGATHDRVAGGIKLGQDFFADQTPVHYHKAPALRDGNPGEIKFRAINLSEEP
jgi:hypothetical protein